MLNKIFENTNFMFIIHPNWNLEKYALRCLHFYHPYSSEHSKERGIHYRTMFFDLLFHFVFIKLTFLGLWIHRLEMVESVARHLMFNLLNHVLYFHVSFSMHYFYTYLSIFGITKESLVMGISTRTLISKAWNSTCNLLFDLWNGCSSYIATKR